MEQKPLVPIVSQVIAHRFGFYSWPNYYVYALCYASGLPFYVGMGTRHRCLQHVGETARESLLKKRWTEKNEVISAIGLDAVWYHFFALVQDRTQASQIEAYWIQKWGRRVKGGMLVNSAKPESTLDDVAAFPPPLIDDQEEVIRAFQHPDIILVPPYARSMSPRSGALIYCMACGVQGQYSGKMRDEKVLCGNCGHYMVPWTKETEDGSNRVFFGSEVLES